MNTDLRERSYALLFYSEDSIREVWQIMETIEDDEFDEENEQQIVLTVNEPIDPETEYPREYFHRRICFFEVRNSSSGFRVQSCSFIKW